MGLLRWACYMGLLRWACYVGLFIDTLALGVIKPHSLNHQQNSFIKRERLKKFNKDSCHWGLNRQL
jgi:hypothetical protein